MTVDSGEPTIVNGSAADPNRVHLVRLISIWAVLSLVFTPVVYFVWGPHMPPGNLSDVARSQQFDNAVLAAVATPVMLFIWVYFVYVLVAFRSRGSTEDGPPIKGHVGFQAGWLVTTAVIVMSLFVFGTYALIKPNGAGTGSGANPIWVPAGYSGQAKGNKILQVQVIAQQWRWTFRYPAYEGVETTQLEIPVGVQVQFNVTSLDVIHGFWAYQLGVKADANPGVNNVAFAKARRVGKVDVRCEELCGTLHGAMYTSGAVVSPADFATWITNQIQIHAADIPLLPPYATTYLPTPDGGYYDPSQDPVPDTSVPPSPSASPAATRPSGAAGTEPSPSVAGASPTNVQVQLRIER